MNCSFSSGPFWSHGSYFDQAELMLHHPYFNLNHLAVFRVSRKLFRFFCIVGFYFASLGFILGRQKPIWIIGVYFGRPGFILHHSRSILETLVLFWVAKNKFESLGLILGRPGFILHHSRSILETLVLFWVANNHFGSLVFILGRPLPLKAVQLFLMVAERLWFIALVCFNAFGAGWPRQAGGREWLGILKFHLLWTCYALFIVTHHWINDGLLCIIDYSLFILVVIWSCSWGTHFENMSYYWYHCSRYYRILLYKVRGKSQQTSIQCVFVTLRGVAQALPQTSRYAPPAYQHRPRPQTWKDGHALR